MFKDWNVSVVSTNIHASCATAGWLEWLTSSGEWNAELAVDL